jgi:hypothetical protein
MADDPHEGTAFLSCRFNGYDSYMSAGLNRESRRGNAHKSMALDDLLAMTPIPGTLS